jgi:RNA polymerase sigma-70 factor, ECF subfamily
LTDWDRLCRIHAPMVWNTVVRIVRHREDALDCCQDVFAEAIERDRCTPVADWGAFLRWLATRRAIDYLRRRDRRAVVTGDVENVQGVGLPAETNAAFEELVNVVRAELARLPDQQAEAFWLVCVEQRTYEEVARHMGITRNAVGVLVHRARRHMRSKLNSLSPLRTE